MASPDHKHPCNGCALQEARDGRVCPAARDAYNLPDVEAEHHGAALHAAILADAQSLPGFAELARRDALSHPAGALPASIRLGLLAAPSSQPVPHHAAKEVVHALTTARPD
jgi:hypothetical protein